MSTAVAVNRQPSDVSFYSDHRISKRCAALSSTLEPIKKDLKPVEHAELESRLEKALRDRDDQWRRHEKEQITFLQNETTLMLTSLHGEVNRLSNELREAKRISMLNDSEENCVKLKELERLLDEKNNYAANLEKKVTLTIQKLQEQISIQSERIRQLNDELSDRNQTVAHLSQQLRGIKLREAMATSHHRRRASQQNSPPVTSPSSPHRIFPPVSSGLLSASVAVTYPGRVSANIVTRRSNSAARSPSMPN